MAAQTATILDSIQGDGRTDYWEVIMSRGPNGEKRPADTVGCAVTVAKIATGEIEEELPANRQGKVNGGKARAKGMTPHERSALAREAAKVRWARSNTPKLQVGDRE